MKSTETKSTETKAFNSAEVKLNGETFTLDCYPYTFSPLLLFVKDPYFDEGYSNYNSVEQFFRPCLNKIGVDMLQNVLYDRKNMLYEELLAHVSSERMLVTCCIDSHFTAFQVCWIFLFRKKWLCL